MQELSAISSQSCQASDCHCRKMLHRLDQICELQWQSEERQIWLPMAGGSCTGWSNLRSIVPIYEVYRYVIYFLNFDPKSRNLLPFFGLKLQIKPLQTIQKNKNVPKPPKSGTYSNKHNTIFLLLWLFPMLRQIYLREYLFPPMRKIRKHIVWLY